MGYPLTLETQLLTTTLSRSSKSRRLWHDVCYSLVNPARAPGLPYWSLLNDLPSWFHLVTPFLAFLIDLLLFASNWLPVLVLTPLEIQPLLSIPPMRWRDVVERSFESGQPVPTTLLLPSFWFQFLVPSPFYEPLS